MGVCLQWPYLVFAVTAERKLESARASRAPKLFGFHTKINQYQRLNWPKEWDVWGSTYDFLSYAALLPLKVITLIITKQSSAMAESTFNLQSTFRTSLLLQTPVLWWDEPPPLLTAEEY